MVWQANKPNIFYITTREEDGETNKGESSSKELPPSTTGEGKGMIILFFMKEGRNHPASKQPGKIEYYQHD
jgi:hypothetical protein